ncbi:MAG: lipase family protein [Mucilaginibacter polytrichastri]|nr:lipase family protein [Mucilaginibacter polytrichastri]
MKTRFRSAAFRAVFTPENLVWLLLVVLFTAFRPANAQSLKPGYNKPEYLEMLRVSQRQVDTLRGDTLPLPEHYRRVYRSPTFGLENRWDLWTGEDRAPVISIRGTTSASVSWIENFYAAMVPASGSIQLEKEKSFSYHLAENKDAMVHVGWLTALAVLSPTITDHIRSLYKEGHREFIIMGHSQGAAIAYLLRSYLFYETAAGRLPGDIVYKTYCSAAPKPGNLYYAYDYEHITAGGWGITVLNALDWVPETPFSLQTTTDFNPINPFKREGVMAAVKKQPFFQRLFARHAYNRLDKTMRKSQRTMQRYLGSLMYKAVNKTLPELDEPAYTNGNNYMRAGTPVILMPDDAYRKTFVQDPKQIFRNHMPGAYYFIAEKQP